MNNKCVLAFLALFLLSVNVIYALPVTGNTAPEIVKLMGTGWNLGNTLDATGGSGLSSETSWRNPKTTKAMIDEVLKAGFKTVRIPVSWGKHTSQSGEYRYKIDDAWLARVKEVVDYCYDNEMFVILNIHHDNSTSYFYPSQDYRDQSLTFVKDIWTQLAACFADYDQRLIFETLNEPRLVGTSDEWWFDKNNPSTAVATAISIINELNQAAVDVIRANGSTANKERMIMCPGYCASIDGCTVSTFALPTDNGGSENRIALSAHAYTPYQLCLGDDSVTTLQSTMKSDIAWTFAELVNKFVKKGIAVVIGETSVSNKDNLEERLKWVDCFYGYSKTYGIPCVLWDNNVYSNNGGEAHGYLNRSKLVWYEDGKVVVDRIMSVLGIKVSIEDFLQDDFTFSIYPNPTVDCLSVNSEVVICSASLMDVNGSIVSVVEADSNSFTIDMSSLVSGIYFLYLESENGSVLRKIVKK